MATVSADSSTTISVPEGLIVTITTENNTTGTIARTYTNEGGTSQSVTDTVGPPAMNSVYGPYDRSCTMTIACTYGTITYVTSGNSVVTASIDPNTGRIVFSAADRDITSDIVNISSQTLPNGQPLGITRPVTKMGKKIFGFGSADSWTKSISGFGVEGSDYVTTEDYTGVDPTTGVVTGFVSPTGSTKLKKIQMLTTASVEVKKTSVSVPINGKIGIWVYCECASGVTNPNISIIVGSTPGATAIEYYFNNNQLKPNAWNFLVVVRSEDPTSNADREAHPFGLAETIGDFANGRIVSQNLAAVYIRMVGVVGVTMYLDSLWTDFETTPQFVLGADMTGSDTISYVLPKFNQYAWKGYIAQPYRVQDGGWLDVSDWNTMSDATKAVLDAVYAAGWDVINHSVNHQAIGTYTDPTQIRFEINACRAWLGTYGYTRGQEFYVSPMGSSSVLSRNVIESCGIKVQRHGTHDANHVTSFGVDNLTHVGSVDIGGNTWIYNGSDPTRYPYAYPHIQNLRTWVDMIIKYGATGMPFWHGVKTLGDPGDGTGNSGDPIQMFKSTFDLLMDYIAEKEAAGLCRVTDGFTGFYYGSGR